MITYPVDVVNTRWSVIRISTQELVKQNQSWPRADGGEIVGLDPGIALLLHVQAADPAYDPATQRLLSAAPVVDIPANTLTFSRTVQAIPQAELDSATELDQIRAVYLALKNGTGTVAERLTRLEKVVARMIKDQYGS